MPVAVVDPVDIAGVRVQRASLHNTAFVAGLDLRIGDAVFIERRGDVIPQIAHVLEAKRPPGAVPWQPPHVCPACGSTLHLRSEAAGGREGVDMLMCINPDCSGKQGRRLQHFAATCVKGVGNKMILDFIEHGLCDSPVDLYHLADKRAKVCCAQGFAVQYC